MVSNLKMFKVFSTLTACNYLGESATLFMKPSTKKWPEAAPKYFFHLVLQSSSFLAKVMNERAILAEIRMSKHF